MIPAAAEERFQRYLETTVNYNAAIEAAGDRHRDECPACLKGQACSRVPLPWFRDPEKVAKLERHIPGITAMTEDDRRRALWARSKEGNR